MDARIQIVAILATSLLFGVVFELVRRRRLMERYALLWLLSSAVLLGLAVWRSLLERISAAIGIAYAPSALFVIAFGFILVMLLHFSLVISRLSEQNKVLAQRLGLLHERLEHLLDEETRLALETDTEPAALEPARAGSARGT